MLQELKAELKARLPFGLSAGMMILPTTLVKPEDAVTLEEFTSVNTDNPEAKAKRERFMKFAKSHPNLPTRFISMFDEMTEAGIFSNDYYSVLRWFDRKY